MFTNALFRLSLLIVNYRPFLYVFCLFSNVVHVMLQGNEEPAKLNRDVALRAAWPNSLFSNVVFSSFMSQNNPLVLVGFYQTLHHHASKQSSHYVIGFSYEKSAGHRHRQCFIFWKNPVEKCTWSFPRCNVNRGQVTSWRLLVSPPAAPSIIRSSLQVPH
jgi:hypothetical protein